MFYTNKSTKELSFLSMILNNKVKCEFRTPELCDYTVWCVTQLSPSKALETPASRYQLTLLPVALCLDHWRHRGINNGTRWTGALKKRQRSALWSALMKALRFSCLTHRWRKKICHLSFTGGENKVLIKLDGGTGSQERKNEADLEQMEPDEQMELLLASMFFSPRLCLPT